MPLTIIDAHAHCGKRDRFPPQAFADYLARVRHTQIGGAVMFPPVMEIYDRHDPDFADDPAWRRWRREANEYLLTLGDEKFQVFPFLFVWNDFAVEQLSARHFGIKWHRHDDEPRYHYHSPRCAAAIDEIRRRRLPVCLEEELHHTIHFIETLARGVRVIIPHCGLLNGGYEALVRREVWGNRDVFTDTSLVPPGIIMDYVTRYGAERIMFGSDFPFGDPARELDKVLGLALSEEARQAMLSGTLQGLLAAGRSNRPESPQSARALNEAPTD
jgi:hypothetical protein